MSAGAAALALALLATAARADEAGPVSVEPGDACFTLAASTVYLHRLQDRILDSWTLPPDGLADRAVVIDLKIDAEGMLLAYELVSFTNRRLAQSVKHAVMLASPFEPIPGEASCLAGRRIRTTFRNPS